VARASDQQHDGIVLDDGTWVDVGPDGRWRPSPGERARAAVILGVAMATLLLLALVLSVGGGGDEDVEVAATTSAPEEEPRTTEAEEDLDPSSIDGEPASAECAGDDRDARPLRDRRRSIVLVLNGTSRGGHAGAVSEQLRAAGYQLTSPGNAGTRRVTSVAYLAGYCAEAEQVAEDLELPDATIEPVPEELLAVVGRAQLAVSLGADSLGG
jgi:hypothetical protein